MPGGTTGLLGVPVGELEVSITAGRQRERSGSPSCLSHFMLLCRAGLVHGRHHPARTMAGSRGFPGEVILPLSLLPRVLL